MDKSKVFLIRRRPIRSPDDAEACFSQLAENIRGALYLYDVRQGKTIYVSAVFEEVWQRPRHDACGKPGALLEWLHEEDRQRVIEAMDRNALGAATREEYRILRPDGTLRWIEDRAYPVKDASGEVLRVAGLALDITGLKADEETRRCAEERSRESRNTESLERMAGTVAHEFNNLLTSINGFSDILMARMGHGDANRALVEEIRDAGIRAVQVTRQLRDFGLKRLVRFSEPGRKEARKDRECWACGADTLRTVPSQKTGETVLMVEDEEGTRALVRLTLEAGGYTVLEARGAREAAYIRENHSGPIHLLLTDIVLPGRSGREIAREFLELRPGIRIILMSGNTEDTVIRKELERSSARFLGKPFTEARLLQAVRAALGAPAAEAEAAFHCRAEVPGAGEA